MYAQLPPVLTTLHYTTQHALRLPDASSVSQCTICVRCYRSFATPKHAHRLWATAACQHAAARRSTTFCDARVLGAPKGCIAAAELQPKTLWLAGKSAVATTLHLIELSESTQQCLRQGVLFACAL